MDNRVIIIIGTGRSGSSALAGALHKSGIPMGLPEHLIVPHAGNRKGFYEDICFWKLAQGMLGAPGLLKKLKDEKFEGEWLEDFSDTINSHRQEPIWGVKNPGFCAVWHRVEPLFHDDIKILAIHRRFDGVVKSRMRVQDMSRDETANFHNWSAALMHQELHITENPIYHVQYEELVESPETILPPVLDYCSKGLDLELNTEAAIDFIDPGLRHF